MKTNGIFKSTRESDYNLVFRSDKDAVRNTPQGDIMPISEWKDITSIVASITGVAGVLFAICKFFRKYSEGLKFKRAQFFLNQHRRLFSDNDLFEILSLIDNDDRKLKEKEMWDKKRKFLVFIEELCLLVKANYVSKNAAFYMFGHYSELAHDGLNFKEGILFEKKYFGLFIEFVGAYKKIKPKLSELDISL